MMFGGDVFHAIKMFYLKLLWLLSSEMVVPCIRKVMNIDEGLTNSDILGYDQLIQRAFLDKNVIKLRSAISTFWKHILIGYEASLSNSMWTVNWFFNGSSYFVILSKLHLHKGGGDYLQTLLGGLGSRSFDHLKGPFRKEKKNNILFFFLP